MEPFEEVYTNFFSYVYQYALSLCGNEALAEEVTQETFFKALKNIKKFRGECKLNVWLCQIAKNTYFSMCQRNKKSVPLEMDLESGQDIEEVFISQESALEVHRILHGLEEPYKEVFSLRVLGQLSFQQIAELFGKSESWARVTFYRAKIKIREKLL